LDLAPLVHKYNFGHCCNRLYYAMSQSVRIRSFLLIDDRKKFCEEILQKIGSDETLLVFVCFSDEAKFHLDGVVSRRNCRIRCSQPPQEIKERYRKAPKVSTATEVVCESTVRDRILFSTCAEELIVLTLKLTMCQRETLSFSVMNYEITYFV
jgi:hypothetical protein